MRVRALALVAGGLVLVVGTATMAVWPRGVTAVTDQEALDDYRSRGSAVAPSGVDATDIATDIAAGPPSGVYAFSASGQEVVKLGALPAEERPYPDRVNVVIVHGEPSCFTVTLNLIDQHTEDTTYCVDETGGLRIDAHTKHQHIGVLAPTAAMDCDPGVLVEPGVDHRDLACSLSLVGGPAVLTADVSGTARVGDPVGVTIGNEEIQAVPVDVAYAISGDLTGMWREQLWFATDTWLPLRIVRDLDLRGLAAFTEHSVLELHDTVPMR